MKLIFPLVLTALAALSCNSATSTSGTTTTTDSLDNSVATEKPNTNYKPAFEGQTRIDAVKTTTPYASKIITESLKSPCGIAVLPDGRLLITEKKGALRIVDPASGAVSEKIEGIGEVDDKGQGGLLGLTLDPDFATNRMVYWVFSEKVDKGNHTAVAK